jgi:uncharacterized protein
VSAETRPRRPPSPLASAPPALEEAAKPAAKEPTPKPVERLPFLLDFFPLETAKDTKLSRFFDRLREGRLSTTRCPRDGEIHWPPRSVCPKCHTEELEWIDLPDGGRLYAFSAVLAGAPLGMEAEVPFAVGLVDLDGAPLRLFGRIEGRPWTELRVGQAVRVEPYAIADGRMYYRFRTVD